MDYKNTLNLPKTDFPMKADLPKREPMLLQQWQDMDVYGLILRKKHSRGSYILHDGPPYANGDIHIGHALNKTLKDIVLKYKSMQGYSCAYVPGWDCHGLPIEHALLKELNIHKSQIAQLEFRKKAHEYAMKYVVNQREQFKRLGIFGDWDNPYLTLNRDYEEAILRSFNALYKKGYISRGRKPVNWCFKCETALAEAEVEYEDHTSPSVFVKFRLDDSQGFKKGSYLVIWTTTPWTLIANVAVAAHPELTYVYVETDHGDLILAKELYLNVLGKAGGEAGIKKNVIVKEIPGRDLEGLTYEHPFGLKKGRVVLADYVSKEEGSGLVHTAPGHGSEDYQTGIKYGLEIVMPVDSRGKFDPCVGEFAGMNVFAANKPIIEKLSGAGLLLWEGKIQHSYPHCWRCKTPIIFRATKQWFLLIDHKEKGFEQPLRERLLRIIKEDVTWVPASGKERISAMVESRPDWCLSRQRYWGVPVPALVCVKCKEEFFDSRLIDRFAELSAREGTDCWFSRDIKDFIPEGLECPYCKSKEFAKGPDILDVWFDSGVSHQAVVKKRPELGDTPVELYLEGSDQHRGWFQSSLIPSVAIDGKAPFRTVLTHGFVVDGDGRKMSKSVGNVVSPFDIIKNYGADIIRLWVASSDYNEDIRISPQILLRLSESYRKIRNTIRFMLSNLYDFDPQNHRVAAIGLRKIDQWILSRRERALADVSAAYEQFEFHKAYKAIYDFCNEDLSMYYLDMVKGRLYTYKSDSPERRAAQTALYEVLNVLTRMIAPILAFTAEEVWQHMPKENKDAGLKSIHGADWPQVDPLIAQREELQVIMSLIPDITKLLEEKRVAGVIGSSFDAKINILTNDQNRYTYLKGFEKDLLEIFKVSQVEVVKISGFDGTCAVSGRFPDVALAAVKAAGEKCQRCWNYTPDVKVVPGQELICEQCAKAIGGT
ncbi:MAG: isoleucine--tRNA ligase [Candidatus Omnitrophota bacterium]